MTTVTSHIEAVERHVWTVPCNYSAHGDGYITVIGELLTAYGMAQSTAKRLGVNTSCDDWAHVQPTDENVRIFFDRQYKKGSSRPLGERLREAANAIKEINSDHSRPWTAQDLLSYADSWESGNQ